MKEEIRTFADFNYKYNENVNEIRLKALLLLEDYIFELRYVRYIVVAGNEWIKEAIENFPCSDENDDAFEKWYEHYNY